jgi:hypothetical protein
MSGDDREEAEEAGEAAGKAIAARQASEAQYVADGLRR